MSGVLSGVVGFCDACGPTWGGDAGLRPEASRGLGGLGLRLLGPLKDSCSPSSEKLKGACSPSKWQALRV